ncbi:MAG: hypothetical protein J5I57_09650 [Melioribacteraceae bacterium]|nr:hypothetical protein [Melioribacteraceae bacterium]
MIERNRVVLSKLIIIFVLLLPVGIYAQVSNYISNVEVLNSKEGEPLTVKADLFQVAAVNRILFYYKLFGETEFTEQEMSLFGAAASTTVSGEKIAPPFIEYFLRVELKDGTYEAYPIGAPNEAAALQVSIQPVSEKDRQIIVLSPTPHESVSLNDLFISISLLRVPPSIDNSATKVFVDDNDVTQMVLFADDLLLFYPENFPGTIGEGNHVLRVEIYDIEGNFYHSITTDFNVFAEKGVGIYAHTFNTFFDLKGESRNERFNDEETWYNNFDGKFRGNYRDWNFNARLFITSEEKQYLQPQNRYFGEVSNDWMFLKFGDNFPRYQELLLDGKRLRGVTGGVKIDFFNVQASYGQINRSVEGRLLSTFSATQAFEDSLILYPNVIKIDETTYGNVNYGTYGRNLFALSTFAEGSNYKFGISYLHSKDNDESIEYGGKPEENAVFGTELKLSFDRQRIVFENEAAFSIYNRDIRTGSLTEEDIRNLFGDGSLLGTNPDDLIRLKDYLEGIITINQYLGPINPEEFSSLAYESALRLNYFNNNFKVAYLYRGNDYTSFGNNYLRKDIQGFNINDRVRLLDNKAFFSVGYERLTDNLQNTKQATTTFNTFNTSVSIYPRADFPNITLGYTRYDNNNDLPSDSIYAVNNGTNSFLASLSYDLNTGIVHNARLSVSTSSREDETFTNSDAKITTGVLTFNSNWSDEFTSLFSAVYSSSEIAGFKYSYTTITAGGNIKLLENKLNLRLTGGPSFGDLERIAVDLIVDYNILTNFSIGLQSRYYKIKDLSNNSIVGLTARWIM